MNWVRFTAVVILVIILQAGMVEAIAVTRMNIAPDLLLILMVFFALYCKVNEVIIASFSIGFAADLISLGIGANILSFGLVGTAVAYFARVLTIKRMPQQAASIFVVGVLVKGAAWLLVVLKGQPIPPNAFAAAMGSSIYSGIIGPFLFLPIAWWMRIKTPRYSR